MQINIDPIGQETWNLSALEAKFIKDAVNSLIYMCDTVEEEDMIQIAYKLCDQFGYDDVLSDRDIFDLKENLNIR